MKINFNKLNKIPMHKASFFRRGNSSIIMLKCVAFGFIGYASLVLPINYY